MNPIQNVFNIGESKLREQAVRKNITKETFDQFVVRARDILMSTPITVIDKIIDTMPKRMKMIIQKKGGRLKYQLLNQLCIIKVILACILCMRYDNMSLLLFRSGGE